MKKFIATLATVALMFSLLGTFAALAAPWQADGKGTGVVNITLKAYPITYEEVDDGDGPYLSPVIGEEEQTEFNPGDHFVVKWDYQSDDVPNSEAGETSTAKTAAGVSTNKKVALSKGYVATTLMLVFDTNVLVPAQYDDPDAPGYNDNFSMLNADDYVLINQEGNYFSGATTNANNANFATAIDNNEYAIWGKGADLGQVTDPMGTKIMQEGQVAYTWETTGTAASLNNGVLCESYYIIPEDAATGSYTIQKDAVATRSTVTVGGATDFTNNINVTPLTITIASDTPDPVKLEAPAVPALTLDGTTITVTNVDADATYTLYKGEEATDIAMVDGAFAGLEEGATYTVKAYKAGDGETTLDSDVVTSEAIAIPVTDKLAINTITTKGTPVVDGETITIANLKVTDEVTVVYFTSDYEATITGPDYKWGTVENRIWAFRFDNDGTGAKQTKQVTVTLGEETRTYNVEVQFPAADFSLDVEAYASVGAANVVIDGDVINVLNLDSTAKYVFVGFKGSESAFITGTNTTWKFADEMATRKAFRVDNDGTGAKVTTTITVMVAGNTKEYTLNVSFAAADLSVVTKVFTNKNLADVEVSDLANDVITVTGVAADAKYIFVGFEAQEDQWYFDNNATWVFEDAKLPSVRINNDFSGEEQSATISLKYAGITKTITVKVTFGA